MTRGFVLPWVSVFTVLAGLALPERAWAQANGLFREIFENISGAAVADLTNSAAFRNNQPDYSDIIPTFETETDVRDNYGQRVRGYLIPPTNGTYYFAISTDDGSDLYLGTGPNPATKTRIAYVSSWSNSREYNKLAGQISGARALVGGQRYYIEALMKEQGGGDNLAVAWSSTASIPNGSAPISGAYLSYDSEPVIKNQPVNRTVVEGQPASFTVTVENFAPPQFQWQRNSNNIAGANAATLTIPRTTMADNGAYFRCVLTNSVGGAISTNARLTILPDTVKPTLSFAANFSPTNVVIVFSEAVSPSTATNQANYRLNGGISVSSVIMSDDSAVILTVSQLTYGNTYTVTVSNVTDQAATPNAIVPNSQIQFVAASFVAGNIGNPTIGGSTTEVGGGYDITGAGTNMAGASDQFFFYYRPAAGPFDYTVRLEGLSLSDLWAKAGLMARENLAPNARFAMAVATPSASGAYFLSRSLPGGDAVTAGQFPVNYPQTWLRLTRSGDLFRGYASLDGQTWVELGSVTLTNASASFYLGMAVCGATPSGTATTTAQFRDYGTTVGGTVVASLDLPWEPLGPSTRNGGLIISEIMYHPKHSNDLEFIEIFNAGLIQENLTGWRLSGDVEYAFPTNTILPAGAFLVVARNPGLLQQAHGIGSVLGPWLGAATNALPDSGGRIRLRNSANAVALEVNYLGVDPWPLSADGAGHSLVLARPSYGQDNVKAWAASERIGGTPGRMETFRHEPLRNVVINEFLANSEPPALDFIELYNHSPQNVDVSGAYLSDDRDTNKFRIPANTVLPARGFRAFTQTELGFALSAGGERIYLVNSNQDRVVEVVAFDGQAAAVSSGRHPDGGEGFRALKSLTPGSANSGGLIRDIVINEIMFHPPSENSDDEFLELHNRSTNAMNVGRWRFADGIDFAIPANTIIPPNGFLVIAKNAARLLTNYPQLNAANTIGDYGGNLANGGERIALEMPEYVVTTNLQGVVTTNINWILVNEVRYQDEGRWAEWADGGGSSLELIDPNADNQLVANWADSDETGKAAWTNVTATGILRNVYPVDANGAAMNEVQVMILGRGEALMDDVDVHVGTGANVVANPTFNSGLAGWLIQGNHVKSGLEPAGANNPSQSMRIRATAGGDNGANRVECDLTTTLAVNQTATIGGKFRWLRGFPIVLVRLHGGGLEAVGTLPIPPNLGTPGLPNSRRLSNAGPAIYDVTHSPVLPAANQNVVVTARVNDPDGIALVRLQYRLDPGTSLNTLTMRDDGTGGDAVAGDGVYSATLPAYGANTLVASRITATDSKSPAGSTLFPSDAPIRECLIRYGDPSISGNLGVYRLWMTAANYATWRDRERLSNEPMDGTMVYGNLRAIYNMGSRYRGSPFTRNPSSPVAVGASYVWTLPHDDLFLGTDELNLDSLEPTGRDATALREVTSFTMAEQLGLAFSYQRYVHPVINGIPSGSPVYTDTQQPNGEYVTMWFGDDDVGDLFKIDDWFEFNDTPGMQGNKSASLQVYTNTTPEGVVKDKGRYRWSWEKKFNQGLDDDYSTIFWAVDALNAPDAAYVSQVDSIIDAEQWLTAFALRHVVGDWDGYSYRRGKNQFIYRPDGKRISMLLWDLDFSLGCNSGDGPTHDLFNINAGVNDTVSDNMPEIKRLYDHPHFRRVYYQALLRIADGPLQDDAFLPTLDARYRALQANGVTGTTSPYVASGAQGISIPAWIEQRRNHVYQQLATQTNVAFAVTSPGNVAASSNLMTLTGTAPAGVKTIRVNGVDYPVTWSTTTAWSMRLPIGTGTNLLAIQPYDLNGLLLSNQVQMVTAVFAPAIPEPAGYVVFNELMYHPATPGAEYVEILNNSTEFTFDLSGWRVNGLDYTFPTGSFIMPRSVVLLVKDRQACLAAYGTSLAIFDEYTGNLQSGGETLTLLKPGAAPGEEIVVDRVRYEAAAPWPEKANGQGAALQLVDGTQDNARVSNWSTGGGWQRFSATGKGGTILRLFFAETTGGDVFIDDLLLVDPATGSNYIVGGDFEAPLGPPWTFVGSALTNSHVTNVVSHSGNSCLRLFGNVGSTGNLLTQSLLGIDTSANYDLSVWYLPTDTANNVVVYVSSAFRPSVNVRPRSSTPGEGNNVAAPLPPYPTLWLNEVQPLNVSGVTDNAGQRDPWIELHNPGATPVSLAECYLSDNYTNLTQWAFPSDAVINPGQFLVVWADGQPAQSAPGHPHTSFRITNNTGSMALSRSIGGSLQVLDYLNFTAVPADWSYGAVPDGQPFYRFDLYHPTAGTANDSAPPPVVVSINEWMAANSAPGGWPDPADGDYDDWFELYNPGASPVDLGGYYLTDNLTNRFQFRIPSGYTVPAGGYLLVWADNEEGQNQSNRLDLHVNFALRQAGEEIGLFAADGTAIDTVVFGPQTNNLSEGRYPDGAAGRYFMPVFTPRLPNEIPAHPDQPELGGVVMVGGQVSFSVGTIAGRSYQAYYTDDLGALEWLPLGGERAGTGGPLVITDPDPVSAHGQRFYTVALLP